MKCQDCGTSEGRIINYKKTTPLCWAHYLQMRRHGQTFKRTKYTPNRILLHEDHAEVVLYRGERKEAARAIIDLSDVELVRQYKWHLAGKKKLYAETFQGRRSLHMHVLLMGPKPGLVVDHRNGHGLDNRRKNLRHVTQLENVWNTTPPPSGRIGVWWRKDRGRWYGKWREGGRQFTRAFDSFDQAVAWREAMEIAATGTTATELRAA